MDSADSGEKNTANNTNNATSKIANSIGEWPRQVTVSVTKACSYSQKSCSYSYQTNGHEGSCGLIQTNLSTTQSISWTRATFSIREHCVLRV